MLFFVYHTIYLLACTCIRLFICWLLLVSDYLFNLLASTCLLYLIFCWLLKLDYIFDFPKFAGSRVCQRACGYPWTAGMGIVLCPWRVASAGAGADFSLRVRVYQTHIRADFTHCHLDPGF